MEWTHFVTLSYPTKRLIRFRYNGIELHYINHLHYLWRHITSIIYSICDVTVYIQYTCIIFICMRLKIGKKRTTDQITGPVSQRVKINLIFTNNVRILWLLAIPFRPFGFIAPKTLNYLAFQSFDFERTRWRLFQKRVVCTKFDICVFIMFILQY